MQASSVPAALSVFASHVQTTGFEAHCVEGAECQLSVVVSAAATWAASLGECPPCCEEETTAGAVWPPLRVQVSMWGPRPCAVLLPSAQGAFAQSPTLGSCGTAAGMPAALDVRAARIMRLSFSFAMVFLTC